MLSIRPCLLHIIGIVMFLSSCSWVNDDLSDCPTGTWIEFIYSYNILNVDAAYMQVSELAIFAFDENGKYVGKQDVDSATFHRGRCRVKLQFPSGVYNLMVWGGLSDKGYHFPVPVAGKSQREDLFLSVNCDEDFRQKDKLGSLFYGGLDGVHVSENYQVYQLSLVKDTKYFSCLLQDEAGLPLDKEDFSFHIESANGVIDHRNVPVPDTVPVRYEAYHQETGLISDTLPVIHARLNTLRLMKDDHTMLTLRYEPSGKNILHIPLTPYLLLSKIYGNGDTVMEDQEYLDRQDAYTLLFFVNTSSGIPYVCSRISVNGWIVRLNDTELRK